MHMYLLYLSITISGIAMIYVSTYGVKEILKSERVSE